MKQKLIADSAHGGRVVLQTRLRIDAKQMLDQIARDQNKTASMVLAEIIEERLYAKGKPNFNRDRTLPELQ